MSYLEELRRATETLAKLTAKAAVDYLYGAAMESGGFLTLPDPGNTWSAQTYEVRAYGVFASGETDEAIQRNWARAAAAELAALEALRKEEALISQPITEQPAERMEEAARFILSLARSPAETLKRAERIIAAGTQLEAG
jgi:hypothetical protein